MTIRVCWAVVSVIWVLCAFLVFGQLNQRLSVDSVLSKSGTAYGAECIESRSTLGIKFRVDYGDGNGVVEDLFLLPISEICDQAVISQFNNESVDVFFHENIYLGLDVKGKTLYSVEDGIKQFNNKTGIVSFAVSIAFIMSMAILMYSNRSRKNA